MSDEQDPRHGLADHLEVELPRLERQWDDGQFSALIEAFVLCAGNGYRAPKWVMSAVMDELQWSMANRPRGGTKKGNAVARERTEGIHLVRFLLVERFLTFQQAEIDGGRRKTPLSEIEAARDALAFLNAQRHRAGSTTAEQIRRSWKGLKTV
jgi:hypothetical protein